MTVGLISCKTRNCWTKAATPSATVRPRQHPQAQTYLGADSPPNPYKSISEMNPRLRMEWKSKISLGTYRTCTFEAVNAGVGSSVEMLFLERLNTRNSGITSMSWIGALVSSHEAKCLRSAERRPEISAWDGKNSCRAMGFLQLVDAQTDLVFDLELELGVVVEEDLPQCAQTEDKVWDASKTRDVLERSVREKLRH